MELFSDQQELREQQEQQEQRELRELRELREEALVPQLEEASELPPRGPLEGYQQGPVLWNPLGPRDQNHLPVTGD
jgi:hypothetical protein